MTPFVTWGTNPGQGVPLGGAVPDPDDFEDESDRVARREGAGVHGPRGRHADARHRRSTPSSSARAPTAGSRTCALAAEIIKGRHVADGHPPARRTRLGAGAAAGRGRGPRRGLQGGRRRVARRRLLDVPGHEPRPARAGGAQRVDVQPQLRGPAGQGRTHAPGLGAGRRRDRGPRHAQLARRPGAAGRAPSRPRRPERWTKFTTHTGVGVPLRRSNVDTDQIIPAVYLKRVTRTGFEDGLFAAWRNDPAFVLNQPEYAAGSVLVAGPDFGTGSSREHAVWALQNYGFRVVISLALRRHLPRQRRQGRAARRPGRRQGRAAALGPASRPSPGATVTVDLESRGRSGPATGPTRSRTPSTSTTTRAGGCSRVSTTSASRWRTRTTSRRTRHVGRPGSRPPSDGLHRRRECENPAIQGDSRIGDRFADEARGRRPVTRDRLS